MELMKPTLDLCNGLIWCVPIVALLLDILTYKYRNLANCFLYVQIIHFTLSRMVPNTEVLLYANKPIARI